jgi:hypothetical protein
MYLLSLCSKIKLTISEFLKVLLILKNTQKSQILIFYSVMFIHPVFLHFICCSGDCSTQTGQ